MLKIHLKKGKDKQPRAGNPWIFSGAIQKCSAESRPGEACAVYDASGAVLGSGYYNEHSSIAVRMLTTGNALFDSAVMLRRIRDAVQRRAAILDGSTTCCRLINSEGDFLPGLIVDRYGNGLCMQILTAGMDLLRDEIIACLCRICLPEFIYERSDAAQRAQEKLPVRNGLAYGDLPGQLCVKENGLKFIIDIQQGQKTGAFLDQRENRDLFRSYAGGDIAADCFSHTGGFSVYALAGGTKIVHTIDSSKQALVMAGENRKLNGFAASSSDLIEEDIFSFLRQTNQKYSLLVLDPPKFARHNRDVHQACRGYKDINLLAMRRMKEGAVMFTFSCSHAIDSKLFRQVVFSAAADSGREVQVLHILSHPSDHPVNIAHKEGEYLKGLVLRVI